MYKLWLLTFSMTAFSVATLASATPVPDPMTGQIDDWDGVAANLQFDLWSTDKFFSPVDKQGKFTLSGFNNFIPDNLKSVSQQLLAQMDDGTPCPGNGQIIPNTAKMSEMAQTFLHFSEETKTHSSDFLTLSTTSVDTRVGQAVATFAYFDQQVAIKAQANCPDATYHYDASFTKGWNIIQTRLDSVDSKGYSQYSIYSEPLSGKWHWREQLPYVGLGYSYEDDPTGLMIATIKPDSPASRAGLRTGDVILSVNGLSTKNVNQMQIIQLVRTGEIGQPVTLTVLHTGQTEPVQLSIQRELIQPWP